MEKLSLLNGAIDPGEDWKRILDFTGYEVSNLGKVRSYRTRQGHPQAKPRLLTPILRNGYQWVKLTRVREVAIHTLVLETFVTPRPKGTECRHIDGNPLNNCLSNLSWGTKAENYNDRRNHGTANGGEHHGNAKLTNAVVLQVYEASGTSREIAERFGLNTQLVSRIRNGQSWRSITGAPEEIKPGKKGTNNGRAKLTEAEVLRIRSSSMPRISIAKKYGVSRNLVAMIQRHQIWTHI